MVPTMKSLGIDQLSVEARLSLVEEIWESLATDPNGVPIPDWHVEELRRREAAHAADPTAGSTWEEVKARMGRGNPTI